MHNKIISDITRVVEERRKSALTCKKAENMFTLLPLPVFLSQGMVMAGCWRSSGYEYIYIYIDIYIYIYYIYILGSRFLESPQQTPQGKTQGDPTVHVILILRVLLAPANLDRAPALLRVPSLDPQELSFLDFVV